MGNILGTDWSNSDRGFVGGTMGVAELDLNLFHESKHSILIQRAANEDKKLRYALYGEGTEVCPLIMQYFPQKTYLESVPGQYDGPELVVTTLDENL